MSKNESFYLEGTKNIGVLLCHTLAGSPSQMKPLGKKLHKLGYTVMCPQYDAHGGTYVDVINSEVPLWYENVVDAYKELQKTVEKIAVIGMSIGGTFAIKLAEEYDVAALVSINGPILGFDLYNDLWKFMQTNKDQELIKTYRDHRMNYFKFVIPVGQIEALKKITAPLFVLQGSLDENRYKTSSMMLMVYASSKEKQRKDYHRSSHLILQEGNKKEAIQDIITFIKEQVEKE